METLLSWLDTSVTGGLFGFIGSFVNKLLGLKQRKQENEHELVLRNKDIETIDAEARAEQGKARIEMDINAQQLQGKAYEASLKHDAVGLDVFGSTWLIVAEFIRRTYRPFISTVLVVLFGMIFFDDATTDEMRLQMVNAIIQATVMVLTWWFADRSFNKSIG